MATGPEHYHEAERLLQFALDQDDPDDGDAWLSAASASDWRRSA